MARYFRILVIGCWLLAVSFFTSCQEGGEAGDLLGLWRMTNSDTRYVSFSGSVTLFQSISEGQVFGNFQHVGDSLFIQCCSINSTPTDTAIIENTFGFKPFNNIRLKIEVLNDEHLTLSKDHQSWNFYKY